MSRPSKLEARSRSEAGARLCTRTNGGEPRIGAKVTRLSAFRWLISALAEWLSLAVSSRGHTKRLAAEAVNCNWSSSNSSRRSSGVT